MGGSQQSGMLTPDAGGGRGGPQGTAFSQIPGAQTAQMGGQLPRLAGAGGQLQPGMNAFPSGAGFAGTPFSQIPGAQTAQMPPMSGGGAGGAPPGQPGVAPPPPGGGPDPSQMMRTGSLQQMMSPNYGQTTPITPQQFAQQGFTGAPPSDPNAAANAAMAGVMPQGGQQMPVSGAGAAGMGMSNFQPQGGASFGSRGGPPLDPTAMMARFAPQAGAGAPAQVGQMPGFGTAPSAWGGGQMPPMAGGGQQMPQGIGNILRMLGGAQ